VQSHPPASIRKLASQDFSKKVILREQQNKRRQMLAALQQEQEQENDFHANYPSGTKAAPAFQMS